MDKLTQLRVFIRLAERGNFSAVARDLAVTQSAVSRAVTALEQTLGARLVNRTTRSVSLTEAGQAYYTRCRRILAELDEAETELTALNAQPTGELKVTAPVPFGLMFISPCVARFHALHPMVRIRLDLDDRPLNLIEEGIDVAIRLGDVGSPGLVARRLGASPFITVAAPTYLRERGVPTEIDALSDHHCLAYRNQASRWEWSFEVAGRTRVIPVSGSYESNNLLALKDAALAGIGLARLPLWMVHAEVQTGALAAVLPQAHPPSYDIHAVFPSARQLPTKVRLFVDFIQQELAAVEFFRDTRDNASPKHDCRVSS